MQKPYDTDLSYANAFLFRQCFDPKQWNKIV